MKNRHALIRIIGFGFSIYLLLLQNVFATTVDKIIIFGDSLSDNGNLYAFTSNLHRGLPQIPVIPKNPPYYQGRFSNGPVWIENVAAMMHIPLEDYAYGGAWIEPLSRSKNVIPDLRGQVNYYTVKAVGDIQKDNHLFVILAGANDYLHGRANPDLVTTRSVYLIRKQIDFLMLHGGKNFLVPSLPDLSLAPEVVAKGPDFAALMKQLTHMHNTKLVNMLSAESKVHPDMKFIPFDTEGYLSDVVAHPDKYQLKNSTEACFAGTYNLQKTLPNQSALIATDEKHIPLQDDATLLAAQLTAEAAKTGEQPCPNPDDYVFWDHLHPTKIVHQMVATLTLSVLAENDIH